jgi:dUTP pyrophosphatase
MKRELSFKAQINHKQGTANQNKIRQNKIKQNETKEDTTMTFNINVKKLNENAILPTYGSEYAAGADLYACLEAPVTIEPGETVMIHTGLAMEIPVGYAGLIYARSGLASKKGLAPANKVGVVDSDYRGEFMVALHNHSLSAATVEPGERIAQMVITPYVTGVFQVVDELEETKRGAGGFGSTGRK